MKKNKFAENSYVLNARSGGNSYNLKCKQHHVDIADKKISHLELFTVSSIENLPFNDDCFDGIICVGSVINYCDAMQTISEFSRVLKRNDILIIEFENSYGYEFIKCSRGGDCIWQIIKILSSKIRRMGNDLETTEVHYSTFSLIDSNNSSHKGIQIFIT